MHACMLRRGLQELQQEPTFTMPAAARYSAAPSAELDGMLDELADADTREPQVAGRLSSPSLHVRTQGLLLTASRRHARR